MAATLKMATDKDTVTGAGCLTLFGLAFALCGVGAGTYLCWIFFDALAMRTWEPVPVHIQRVELESHTGDDSTTYSVSANYTYEFAGLPYTGDRVGISGSSDSFEGYHRRLFERLDRHRQEGTPFIGYINPRAPTESILVREIRLLVCALLMLFPAIFWPVGAGISGAAIWAAGSLGEESKLKQLYPDEPWKWRSDWKDGFSKTQESGNILMFLLLALPVCTLPTILSIFALWQIQAGNYLEALYALPWVIIQLLTVTWFLILRGRLRRFGKRTLEFGAIPVRAGDSLDATLHVEGALPHHDPIEFEVKCVRKVTVKTSDGNSTKRSELWKKAWSVEATEVDRRGRGSSLPITVQLPPDLPTGLDTEGNTEIEWKLDARCKTSGYDFVASFELPVFGAVERRIDPDENVATIEAEPIAFNPKVLRVQEVHGGGIEFDFYRGRLPGTTVMLFFFVLIFGGATTAVTIQGDAPRFMMIIFGIVSVGILLAAIQSLTGSIRTTVNYDALTVERVLLLRRTTRAIPRTQLKDITVRNGMTVNNLQYFDLFATLNDDKRVKLGNNFPSKHEADAIAAMMRVGMGIEDSPSEFLSSPESDRDTP